MSLFESTGGHCSPQKDARQQLTPLTECSGGPTGCPEAATGFSPRLQPCPCRQMWRRDGQRPGELLLRVPLPFCPLHPSGPAAWPIHFKSRGQQKLGVVKTWVACRPASLHSWAEERAAADEEKPPPALQGSERLRRKAEVPRLPHRRPREQTSGPTAETGLGVPPGTPAPASRESTSDRSTFPCPIYSIAPFLRLFLLSAGNLEVKYGQGRNPRLGSPCLFHPQAECAPGTQKVSVTSLTPLLHSRAVNSVSPIGSL